VNLPFVMTADNSFITSIAQIKNVNGKMLNLSVRLALNAQLVLSRTTFIETKKRRTIELTGRKTATEKVYGNQRN